MKNSVMINCVIVKYQNNYTLVMGENETLYGIIGAYVILMKSFEHIFFLIYAN